MADLTEQMAAARRMESYGRTSVGLAAALLIVAGAALAVAIAAAYFA